ncbi:restriction endonuclease subunit M [Oscillospiraceae bacterium OttesenSCG-928-F05]|nr:restriction endonuclease subunit M [Oscillospiraceae bacterium OttesenSCG-928-F05]
MKRITAMASKNSDLSKQDGTIGDLSLIDVLLKDRTTKRNIIWATDDYNIFGAFYCAENEITADSIRTNAHRIIQPRVAKSLQSKTKRAKGKAEVFTPSWVCNAQNNLVDNDWLDAKSPFNREKHKSWETNFEKVLFKIEKEDIWQNYVDAPRLEAACGEAPYLVSRYDPVTGDFIPLQERIGLLDRKLRIVNENTQNKAEWIKWASRAFQSVYGFEFQGDSLFIARENLLYTFIDNYEFIFNETPATEALLHIANIISWNIWQMDGLKFTVPYSSIAKSIHQQLSFFQERGRKETYCVVKDWKAARWKKKSIVEFRSLVNEEV